MGKLNGVTLDEQVHLLVKGYNFCQSLKLLRGTQLLTN